MIDKKEMIAPYVSVGADTEQSSQVYNISIISDESENINGFEKNMRNGKEKCSK